MSTGAATGTAVSIDPATVVGTVRLTVSDLARSRAFYEGALGLRAAEPDGGALGLRAAEPDGGALAPRASGAAGAEGEILIELHGDASAPALDRRATGLFHLALLYPSRRDLAYALARLAHAGWPLDGASDHLVSEALYLSDPDGNGIELYHDRPRAQWSYRDGSLQMATLPLDLDDLLRELEGERELQTLAPAATGMGHVHLQVAELRDTEAFYHGVLGFDVVVRSYPGALFVSAGGYHHHLGLNTWNSRGSQPPRPGSVGLRSFDVVLPHPSALARVVDRVGASGIAVHDDPHGVLVRDPSGNAVVLRSG